MKTEPARSWRDGISVHPAANELPSASAEDQRKMQGDLARQGQLEEVVLVRIAGGPEQLLDGRTRLDLQEANGKAVIDADGKLTVPYRTVALPDDRAALAYVLSLNLFRRHLGLDERRALCKKLLVATPEKSDRQIGKIVGFSHPTVAKERKELEAKGDVVKVSTSTDSKGRKQPRARAEKKPKKAPPVQVTDLPKTEPASSIVTEIMTAALAQPSASASHPDPSIGGNPIIQAWREADEEERGAFAKLFGRDVARHHSQPFMIALDAIERLSAKECDNLAEKAMTRAAQLRDAEKVAAAA